MSNQKLYFMLKPINIFFLILFVFLIILGEKDFIKIMQNYHSWTGGLGKRNIQCLIFALSLLNYIIDTKSLVCL